MSAPDPKPECPLLVGSSLSRRALVRTVGDCPSTGHSAPASAAQLLCRQHSEDFCGCEDGREPVPMQICELCLGRRVANDLPTANCPRCGPGQVREGVVADIGQPIMPA